MPPSPPQPPRPRAADPGPCPCGPGCRCRRGSCSGVFLRALALLAISGGLGLTDLARRPFTMLETHTVRAAAPGAAPATGNSSPSVVAPAGMSLIPFERALALFERGKLSGDAAFIDARTATEFAAGHIPLAYHLPLDAFFGGKVPPDLDMIPRSSALVVYCGGGSCDASIRVSERLRDFGYTEIYIYDEGFAAWQSAGGPVEASGPGATGAGGTP